MRVNTNMNAIVAQNQSTKNTALSGKSMEKISSGLRITKAGDDAAGLAISEKMRSQIRGLDQADRNVQDGISMVQTEEGALQEAGNIVQRVRQLAVQAGNATNESADTAKIQTEVDELVKELDKISSETKFNGVELLSGSNGTTTVQSGADSGQNRVIKHVNLKTITSTLSTAVSTTSKLSVNGTDAALTAIDTALASINEGRANLGAMQNRLEYTQTNLTTKNENITAAESRIRDVDVAKEMINLSKLNILSQASQAMISQANQQPQNVLQLLR